uniref:LCP family protein n=1 Tax=Mycolicibacterium fallax TaxID=1793 RepID=UPI0021F2F301
RARAHRPPATTPGKPPRRRPLLLAGRSLAALFAVLALLLTGSAWQWTASKNQMLNKVAALDPNSLDILDPNAQFGDENFLIVGVDSRYGENAEMGAGDTEDAGGQRSDSIILVNIPANRKRVVAVSFPRDLAITPIECRAWDPQTGEYGPVYDEETGTYSDEYRTIETKINSAYSFGGPKCLVKVIQKISGLSISRFIAVDFAGFSKMVDAVGGVEVCSPTPLEDYELGTVLEHSGHQRIDGHTALNYVRARQVTTEVNGDYGRIKRQQLFLSSLLRSMISSETFFSIKKLNNVVNTFITDSFVDNVKTKDLVDLGQSVQGIAAGRITFVTLPTTGIVDEDGNEEPYTGAIRALFDAIINDDPLPGENDKNETTTPITNSAETTTSTSTAADAEATASTEEQPETTEVVQAVTTDPAGISVHVSNSTERSGLGAAVSEQLELDGFTVDTPDDHPEALSSTTVRYSPGNEAAAVTVAAMLGNPRVERVTGLGQEVRVLLGADFTAVGAPLPADSPVEIHITRRAPETRTADLPEGLTLTNAADASCE